MSKKFYTVFDPPPAKPSPHGGVSLCHQEYLDETNIDVILKRVGAGDTTHLHQNGVFADVSTLGDFAQSMEVVRKANEDFMALPSKIRDRFGNDPSALVAFLQDSSNDAEAIRLGLKVKVEAPRTLADDVRDGVMAANAATKPAQAGEGSTD